MILFDTDTLTHFAYGQDNVRRKLDETDDTLAITIITRYEVIRGRTETLLKAATEDELRRAVQRLQQAEELLAAFVLLTINDVAIHHFGRLRRQKNTKKIGRADSSHCLFGAGLRRSFGDPQHQGFQIHSRVAGGELGRLIAAGSWAFSRGGNCT